MNEDNRFKEHFIDKISLWIKIIDSEHFDTEFELE